MVAIEKLALDFDSALHHLDNRWLQSRVGELERALALSEHTNAALEAQNEELRQANEALQQQLAQCRRDWQDGLRAEADNAS